MKARAPGKLVLSGAYAVLWGAPAVVTAVDRYVQVDGSRPAGFRSAEVMETLKLLHEQTGRLAEPPWFRADALREGERKLGLGSSAAICIASLWVRLFEQPGFASLSSDEQRRQAFELALQGHRIAQGGGSGIDVAAATFGGTLVVTLQNERLELAAASLPPDLVVETWAMTEPASTSEFVAKVRTCQSERPEEFARAMEAQRTASERAATALTAADNGAFIPAVRQQHEALHVLGQLARIPIVLPSVRELHGLLPKESCFLPSGAGGGDITLYFGKTPSSAQFRARAQQLSLVPIALGFAAPGVSTVD